MEGNLDRIKVEILKDLVRVYQQIAKEYQIEGQYESSLQFYTKCVHVSQQANDVHKEAECY